MSIYNLNSSELSFHSCTEVSAARGSYRTLATFFQFDSCCTK